MKLKNCNMVKNFSWEELEWFVICKSCWGVEFGIFGNNIVISG